MDAYMDVCLDGWDGDILLSYLKTNIIVILKLQLFSCRIRMILKWEMHVPSGKR